MAVLTRHIWRRQRGCSHLSVRSGPGRHAAVIVLAAFACVAISRAYAAAPAYGEYEVKAAFLCKFAKFVEWPEEALPREDTPIVIGVLGDDPFGTTLDKTVDGKTVKGRAIKTKRASSPKDLKECHIVFVCASEKARLKEIFVQFKTRNVLTVGETDGFTEKGGIIQFAVENKKIGLRISNKAGKRAGLKISSQLLKLDRDARARGQGKS